MKISKIDQFESKYTPKFHALVAAHGVIIETPKDRAAFDLGMIPTQNINGTKANLVNPVHVWFQLKGVMASTKSADAIKTEQCIKVVVKRAHLHFWHYYPSPIYLVVYAEATDKFYFMDVKRWITEQGVQSILELDTETKTIAVSTDHPASSAVFEKIRTSAQLNTVATAISGTKEDAGRFLRDDSIISRLSTLQARKRVMRVRLVKYGSKMRSEVHFDERNAAGGDWETFRQHWQFSMGSLDSVYPYLTFQPAGPVFKTVEYTDEEGHSHKSLERVDDNADYFDDEDLYFDEGELLPLGNGLLLQGEGQFEMFEFSFTPILNDVGLQWAAALNTLIKCGVLTVSDEPTWVSVAPWNKAL